MKYANEEIENELIKQRAKLIRFVDISHLTETQNRQFPNAVVFALHLIVKHVKHLIICCLKNDRNN